MDSNYKNRRCKEIIIVDIFVFSQKPEGAYALSHLQLGPPLLKVGYCILHPHVAFQKVDSII